MKSDLHPSLAPRKRDNSLTKRLLCADLRQLLPVFRRLTRKTLEYGWKSTGQVRENGQKRKQKQKQANHLVTTTLRKQAGNGGAARGASNCLPRYKSNTGTRKYSPIGSKTAFQWLTRSRRLSRRNQRFHGTKNGALLPHASLTWT